VGRSQGWGGRRIRKFVRLGGGEGGGGLILAVRRLRWISATCEGAVLYYLVLRDN
jgi:hypothetical protein